ncbi:phosphomannomutase/phosphoglucomutase [Humibacillus sp. DSM 29435]|uniref:phosphomannomutase/phosphoglucomutase n=1 Tax=Humibacillus sp. DSM 29435 TaxID=1869167 RepID=UPI00087331B2|nr:phosphomannomutase/phosphoglucomutase [Humibacillus sp. DSM 29435]OFE18038.1 phosphomannomutase/phosphoglucomutase [Humibacillus sp. DSM 29435]
MPTLADFVKAYDVRGLVPEQLSPAVATAIGAAFAEVVAIPDGQTGIAVGYDMRPSSPELSAAFAEGVTSRGVNVTMIGLCSTDGLYYASGALDVPGAMFTASHNPARYNGIKLCRSAARPVGQDSGLTEIRDLAQWLLDSGSTLPAPAGGPGRVDERDLLADYAGFLRGLVDVSGSRPLTVVVDAGNGMGGYTVPAVLGTGAGLPELPLTVVPLYFELDGTFPNHEANPLDPANLVDLQAAVREHGADLGIAFDGDADRCFVVDADGEPVSPSAITGLVAAREIARARAGGDHDIAVVHNVISSAAVAEVIREHGATPVRTRVGHSFIKAEMARVGAVFGGEHSAHYYFRDFWFADTGMLAALHVLAALGEQPLPLGQLAREYERYVASGEINSTVAEPAAVVERVRGWATGRGSSIDELDGLTVHCPEGSSPAWWFNVRTSNTEPLLRLNVEADDRETMVAIRDELLALIRADDVPPAAGGPQ